MEKRVQFRSLTLPYLLLLPQIAITLIFFIWPALQALKQSVLLEDPFGLSTEFVWLDNFSAIFADEAYLESLGVTAVFSLSVALLALSLALFLAIQADRVAHRVVLELAGVHQRLDAARAELRAAMQRRQAIELLRDRHFERWRKAQEKAETTALDELAARARFREERA